MINSTLFAQTNCCKFLKVYLQTQVEIYELIYFKVYVCLHSGFI